MSASRPAGGGGDLILGGVLAAVIGFTVVVWAWGELAGGLFGAGWPHVGPGELAGTLARLPGRLGDPAAAWPPAARHGLPGAAGFYAAFGLLAVAGTATGVALSRGATRLGLVGSGSGARWARGGELAALRDAGVTRGRAAGRGGSAGEGRLVLGRHHGRLLRAEAATRSSPSDPRSRASRPAWPSRRCSSGTGPPWPRRSRPTCWPPRRRGVAGGHRLRVRPFGLSGAPAQTWSPLRAARTWDGALETAWRLAAAGELDQKGVEGGDFWAVAAEQRLAPLLHVAAVSELDMEAVVRWAHGQGTRELDTAVAAMTGAASDQAELDGAHAAYDALRAFEAQADRTRTSIEATVQGLLRAYRFRRVLESARSARDRPRRAAGRRATPCT